MGENERIYNLTHPQKRIWYIEQINFNSPLHNIGGCLKINQSIDIDKLQQTINIIVKKNEGLRLRFLETDGQIVQYAYDFKKENIDFLDFSNYEVPEAEFKKWSESLFKRNFQLKNNQLYYFAIYKISEKEYGVVLNIHHIIADGWSISLIEKQVCEVYSKLINNNEISIDQCYSYLDYIKDEEEYLNSERFIKNKNFWKDKFSDVPEEFLYKTSNSLEGKRLCFNIDSELSNKIKKFADDKKCSLNTFFIAILLIYINKVTYKNDLVIGTPVFNRTNKDQKNMIGMFTSTVPVRFKLDTKLKIEDLIKVVNRELKLCFLNQKYPYDFLIRDLELSKDGYDSLFKMCVNYYNSKYDNHIDDIDVEVKEYYCGNQSYSLQLTVKEWEESNITLNFDYKTLEYSDNQIKTMHEAMINIVNQIVSYENIVINDLKLVNKEECNYKVYDLNSTNSYYPNKTVCELFEEQVIKTPNKIALEFKEKILTYKELNEKSNQLANYLREKGIGNRSIVAIMETHSIDLMISILASLKAGAAYLPIDPSYPVERINYMLEDSKSNLLLTNFKTSGEIKFKGNIININNEDLQGYSKSNLQKYNTFSDLVYIIYTSGSTGKPKGVMIEHRGLTNYIWWANKMYLKDEDEAMALYSSISFDLTVTSIFTPLISGNKIIIYDNDETEFVLYKVLRENKTTVVKLTPAHLTLLKDINNSLSNIKRFIVGGEDLKVNLAKEVYNSFGKNIDIYNEYGPTETVVGCMIYKYDEEKDKEVSVPIGHPADNVQIYILDNELNPVSTGFVGEIYISGDGVASGYLNREGLTHERFIENPFIKGKRMYRTGDTARYLENGVIEYVGRIDNQVKIRGHRIELGEIERYLIENDCVKDAVVVSKEDSSGNKILNAYVVSKREITELEIKIWLFRFLPKYMIPNNFIFMERIPLTSNGKLNTEKLPEPVMVQKEFINYKTPVEKEIVEVMKEILDVENISMNDNYYQLGGDSIKAIQISSKLKNIGIEIRTKDILTYDSIEEIAAAAEENQKVMEISQEQREGFIEKTPIVEWFFSKGFKNENLYNQYVLLEFNKRFDADKVMAAANELIDHHDSLRINFDRQANNLYYHNTQIDKHFVFKYLELDQSCEEISKNVKALMDEVNITFDIEDNLLFNITMVDLQHGMQALLFTAHHLIVDGVSWRIILEDFFTMLKQLENSEEITLPMKTHSYKEWAQGLQEYCKRDFDEETAYWNSVVENDFTCPEDFAAATEEVEELEVEAEKRGAQVQGMEGSTEVIDGEIEEEALNTLIKKVNLIYSLELNEVLIIALAMTINKLTGKEDVIIELERHGREVINNHIDVSRTVGWFTSMYPAHFKVQADDIDCSIKALKEQLRSIPNKGFHYSIIKYLKKQLVESKEKLIRFNYLGDFDNVMDKERLSILGIKMGLDTDRRNSYTALIDFTAVIVDRRLKLSVSYDGGRFKKSTMKSLLSCYMETLNSILEKSTSMNNKEFTPSDFEAVDISMEDLNSLFS